MKCYKKEKSKACFLDRDGVLVEEVNYLGSPEQVNIFPESIRALQLLKDNNYKVIVVTNQAGVARGFFTEDSISEVHKEIDRQLTKYKLNIDHYYYCPHHPDGTVKKYAIDCNCRKPMPGMILQAVKDYDIDISKSFLVGDKVSDLMAAENSGCSAILVETGHGKEHKKNALEKSFSVFANIEQAVLYFFNKDK